MAFYRTSRIPEVLVIASVFTKLKLLLVHLLETEDLPGCGSEKEVPINMKNTGKIKLAV